MSGKGAVAPIRILPEDVANKIAAGEVVERPASVVKELIENALDALATRIVVRLVAAGRRTIEVLDNGHGMSEQDALLSIERHATSKIRRAEDLDNILTLGFRGEALASIASVSRFELVSRRAKDESASRIRVEGGILRENSKIAAPVGTRVTVNRLYFNTPARAKFLKGITTELGHAIDIVQRHALSHEGVAFQFLHNEKMLLDIPENATLRERVALIWGLTFSKDLVDIWDERAGLKVRGLIGTPHLTRGQRSHQFFFLNQRPIVNRALQYGFEDGYRELVTIGRHPVGILLLETHPRFVDVNIHPTKREIRFRDERAARDALRDIVRERLAGLEARAVHAPLAEAASLSVPTVRSTALPTSGPQIHSVIPATEPGRHIEVDRYSRPVTEPESPTMPEVAAPPPPQVQTEFLDVHTEEAEEGVKPFAVYQPIDKVDDAPLQVFGTYLIVPEEDRLLIIDQHALHERLTYDSLREDLDDSDYEAQRLAVPLLFDVPPSHAKLLEENLSLFSKLGIDIEPFGGNTYQITALCHRYEESRISDVIYRVLDTLAQGDLFDKENFLADLLRLAVEACRGSVKAGDLLTPEERRGLLDGFRRLRPPYTCPHGRPIITELTQVQMEKSFRRRQ
ncbi:MAG: DNA mismatch repair endonuclease MutL [Candidatus Hydrogenedentes bacterium]|nr:DNA mismatch repair endonuclease MutL [Candidatus Hydrogenedentota bacterium]